MTAQEALQKLVELNPILTYSCGTDYWYQVYSFMPPGYRETHRISVHTPPDKCEGFVGTSVEECFLRAKEYVESIPKDP
jgi:hypothetical protein